MEMMFIVEDDAINNGKNVVIIVQERNIIVAADSKKEGKIMTSRREHKKTGTSISYEVLERHFGMKRDDAAEKLGISRSTLKRMCRQHEIPRWPSHKRNKVSHPLSDQDPPSSSPHTDQAMQDGRTATIKATYRDDIIKFQLSFSSGMVDLEEEVAKRLKLEIGTFKIKYMDEDSDWILIACDADLKNFMHLSTSSATATLKLLVQPRTNWVEKALMSQRLPTFEIKNPQLTQQEMKIVDYVFDSRESTREMIVSYPLEHATRDVMNSLRAGEWLHDVIINLVVGKMTLDERRRHPDYNCVRWYLPTYFAQHILAEGAQVRVLARRYFGHERYTGALSAVEKVFIPVNDRSLHWFLCVIDMPQRAVYILDSLLNTSSNKDMEKMVRKIVNFLDEVLDHLHKDEYKSRIADFPIQWLGWVPQQKNSFDCGVFVIKFMKCENLQPGMHFAFDSEHARAKIVVDLILEEQNKVRNHILDKVQRYQPRMERSN